jgi:hypothetical protein
MSLVSDCATAATSSSGSAPVCRDSCEQLRSTGGSVLVDDPETPELYARAFAELVVVVRHTGPRQAKLPSLTRFGAAAAQFEDALLAVDAHAPGSAPRVVLEHDATMLRAELDWLERCLGVELE